MLIVVRHAVAVERAEWTGPDVDRPLTPLGERQAAGLVPTLAGRPVARILSSPTVRCRCTVTPLARDRGLPVEPAEVLGKDTPGDELLEAFWREDLHDAVLCTHGETIGHVLPLLAAEGRLETEPVALEWPKGSTWLLQRVDRRRVSGRYLPPPTHDPDPTPLPPTEDS
jgi:broad specificity phosphatase PhoE